MISDRPILRPYAAADVDRLRGSVQVEHTLARLGAERLRRLLADEDYVAALGAMTGGQAVQMVKAGLNAIYLSGWQVAADANLSGHTYPDQSLYPATSAPALLKRLNNALLRADQIARSEGDESTYWLAPIVADTEAGFGGPLNAFELMKGFIEAGAAAVHFEDQLSSEKSGPGLPRRGDDRLRATAGARVRPRGRRRHRDAPPARGRRRVLRPGSRDDHGASATLALRGSTEEGQFADEGPTREEKAA
jgi:Isocitrate lyase family